MPHNNEVQRYNFFEAWPRKATLQTLTAELLRCGVSSAGARQFLAAENVSSLGDRRRLAQVMDQEFDLTGGGGPLQLPAVQKIRDAAARMKAPSGVNLTAIGAQQFFSFQPVTDANDRQFLAAVIGAALGTKVSGRLKYGDIVLKRG